MLKAMQTESANILSTPRFEPRSQGQATDTLANSATPPLYHKNCFTVLDSTVSKPVVTAFLKLVLVIFQKKV